MCLTPSNLIMWTLLLIPSLAFGFMPFCEYYRHLGIRKAQCEETLRVPVIEYEPETTTVVSFPICHGYYHSCMKSGQCASGTICTSAPNNAKCCTSPQSRCPSPTELNIACRSTSPTNWCFNDADCGASFDNSQCCPTGCNYNICFRPTVPLLSEPGAVDFRFSSLMMSPDCPDPFEIPLRCVVPNPVSWCYKQSDCPSVNSLHPRRCCRTRCGYNTCHIRYNGQWLIA